MGSSSVTGDQTILFADNMCFDGTHRGAPMALNGQLWIGATASNRADNGGHVRLGSLTSPAGTITIGYSAPNITLDITGGATAIEKVALQTGISPIVSAAGIINFQGAVVAAGTNPVRTDGTGPSTMALEVQISQAIAATDATKIGLANFNSTQFTVDANGFVSLSGTGAMLTLTPNEDFDGTAATPISPQAGNINVFGSVPSFATVTETYNTTGAATGNLAVEHRAWLTGLVVDASTTPGTRGTFSTIASALTAAVSGQDIFIRPGTYTENLTLKVGVNLVGFMGDELTPQVTIIGNATLSTAGTVTISNIRLQTNSAAVLTISGSVNSIVNLKGCYINCTNATGISLSSSGSSFANLYQCNGNLGTTGISYFSQSSNTGMTWEGGVFGNTGNSTTASVADGNANFVFRNTDFQSLLSATTNTANFVLKNTLININNTTLGSLVNGIGVSLAGASGTLFASNSSIGGGTSSAVSIGTGTVGSLYDCTINSTNTNAITGAGSISYSNLAFSNTSSTINTTTKTVAGTIQGSKNTAPTTGFLGEQLTANATAVSLSNNVAKTVTSVTLTAGIWDISGFNFTSHSGTWTQETIGISTTNNTLPAGNAGQNQCSFIPGATFLLGGITQTLPPQRVNITTNTTYYLVCTTLFSSGTASANGYITATRVG